MNIPESGCPPGNAGTSWNEMADFPARHVRLPEGTKHMFLEANQGIEYSIKINILHNPSVVGHFPEELWVFHVDVGLPPSKL